MKKPSKVFVSGCFDLLHSCHIMFLKHAATFGDHLYVSVGSDDTVHELKGRWPVYNERERVFMVGSLACVHDAFVASGSGLLDFEPELREIHPDTFVVGYDGDASQKRTLCDTLGIQYVTINRHTFAGMNRSTTDVYSKRAMPYRVDLAGGWLDQPFVSKYADGPVITISIEPAVAFNVRSGMATSTRNNAIMMWGHSLPIGDPELLAKQLFCFDNPPGTKHISGSQDALGIVMPGLNRLDYANGDYWPKHIETMLDDKWLDFVESHLHLLSLGMRLDEYDPLMDAHIDARSAQRLSDAAYGMWDAIMDMDSIRVGAYMRESLEAQVIMFPHMITDEIRKLADEYEIVANGYKLSGAGGGGYLIFWSDIPLGNMMQIHIRR